MMYLVVTSPQFYFVSHESTSEENWPGVLQNLPPFGFVCCFCIIRLVLQNFEKNAKRCKVPFSL